MFVLSEKVEDTHAEKIAPPPPVNLAPENGTTPSKASSSHNALPYNYLQAPASLGLPSHPIRGVWLSDCKVNLFWAECSP